MTTPDSQLPSSDPAQESGDKTLSRRQVIKAGAVALAGCYLAGAGCFPMIRYLDIVKAEQNKQGQVTEVTLNPADMPEAGQAVFFHFGDEPAVIMREADNSLICMSAKCTHRGCTVKYKAKEALLVCPCHGGRFDPKTGAVVSGPPKEPLQVYKISVEADAVHVRRSTQST